MIRKFCYAILVFLVGFHSGACFSKQSLTQTIYGIDSAQQFNRKSNNDFYIQAGSFIKKPRALQYQYYLQSKTTYSVKTVQNSNFYRVIIGPIHTAQEVRKVAVLMSSPIKTWPVIISSNQIPVPNKAKQEYLSKRKSIQ